MSLHQGEIATPAAGPRAPRDVTHDGPPFLILKNGDWYHGETKIARTALARLFASILYREADGSYWLKNPAEICAVAVEDAPYVATHLTEAGEAIQITTTLDETVTLGPDHALEMRGGVPYIHIRHGGYARATTQLYYALVALARQVNGAAVIESNGCAFKLGAL